LGQANLVKAEYVKAQEIFEADLADHPNNFWALNGLRYSLLKQHKNNEAKELAIRYKDVWSIADVKLTGAVY
jgi:hypothetical protein